ncbi:DUF2793 domain-containing protein [Cohaesibacter celericrescens]|uniref:Ribonuclease III n=1 Tax=Cohaesibacter celericrescens TaxID=2067669 RepID=A0A2N5XQK9_9HYPH|nr:DUF2793 domain-containing protein [Cohaesibacter celericrescens]PLW76793.1 ribonuclease III [Cohaesibacter celericrescens]
MSDTETSNLALPYIASDQAQKHVTHNEALLMLDALLHLSVVSMALDVAPASPDDGARYIVGVGASGDWVGKDNQIASWQGGAWIFYQPQNGWRAWIEDTERLYVWSGAAWIVANEITSLQNAAMVGINTTADATNRLAIRSAASLFNHAGAGHQVKVNKNAVGDTASFLFQSNWSGRAEIGLTGSDDFEFKVSADGSIWNQAMTIDRNSGMVEFGAAMKLKQYSVAGLPDAAVAGSSAMIYVYDETGGAVPAFSDGGNWRRITDRAVVQ